MLYPTAIYTTDPHKLIIQLMPFNTFTARFTKWVQKNDERNRQIALIGVVTSAGDFQKARFYKHK